VVRKIEHYEQEAVRLAETKINDGIGKLNLNTKTCYGIEKLEGE
jgi:hypothetical protein